MSVRDVVGADVIGIGIRFVKPDASPDDQKHIATPAMAIRSAPTSW